MTFSTLHYFTVKHTYILTNIDTTESNYSNRAMKRVFQHMKSDDLYKYKTEQSDPIRNRSHALT